MGETRPRPAPQPTAEFCLRLVRGPQERSIGLPTECSLAQTSITPVRTCVTYRRLPAPASSPIPRVVARGCPAPASRTSRRPRVAQELQGGPSSAPGVPSTARSEAAEKMTTRVGESAVAPSPSSKEAQPWSRSLPRRSVKAWETYRR